MDWNSCSEKGVPTLQCVPLLFGALIQWALIFSGVTAVFFIALAGIKLLTSGGDKTKVEEGKKTLTVAIVGLIIILLSFFILDVISQITGVECIKMIGFDTCK